jgi:hypothetical protein
MALPCPPDYVAVPILGVMGTAIGTSRVIEVKATWHEGPQLNEAVVGDPGTKKSPAMKLAMKPLFRQQEADERTYHDAKSFHEAEMKRHEVDMEVWRKDAKAENPHRVHSPVPLTPRRCLGAGHQTPRWKPWRCS